MSTNLSIQVGSECIISSLGQDKKITRRIAQMGILPGSKLKIIRLAAFGKTKVTHEAAIGTIDNKQFEALIIHGLSPKQTTDLIIYRSITLIYHV